MKKSSIGVLVLAFLLLTAGILIGRATRAEETMGLQTSPGVTLPPGSVSLEQKSESLLLEQFAAEGRSDFIVRFAQQADLSPAYAMDWNRRGQFVYDALKEAAESSQGRAKAYLNSRGLAYRIFIAGNELYVWSGDLTSAQALAELPEVASIHAPRIFYVDPIVEQEPTNAPDALAWGIDYVEADLFWSSFGLQGDGIKVASIDTGVEWNHDALVDNFACPGDPSSNVCWEDPSNICGGSPCDNNGHGTHTMGTIVASDDPGLTWQAGMAPKAKWIACKGCESSSCSEFALNTCADWILAPGGDPANRPHVVNNSWGGVGCDTWYLAKVQAWRAAGTFPTFSTGNGGPTCNTIGSPGDYQESFASAAHDSAGSIASFSSRGPSCFGHDPYTKPNIAAPGVSICSTIPGNGWSCGYSGTSMASPHSAGAVALLWSCAPQLVGQVDQTIAALALTADPPPTGNCGVPPDGQGNYTYGYGYLNVLEAGLEYCGQVGYLAGHVYDATTSTPIEGAYITTVPDTGVIAVTDPTGYYTMSLIPGVYEVTAFKEGYWPKTIPDVTIITGTVTYKDFYLDFLGHWSLGPDLCFDFTRFDAAYFPPTEKIYVLGGRVGFDTIGDIYKLDPLTGQCQDTGANMPVAISNYTVNLVNNGAKDLLCTFGGRPAAGGTTDEIQCYDPIANNAWVEGYLPGDYGSYVPGAQVVVDNIVYAFGGFSSEIAPFETASTYKYDPVGKTWSQLGDLSMARSYIFAAEVDGLIYAFGGTTYDGAQLYAETIAEVLNPTTGNWSDAGVSDLPMGNAEGRAFGFDSGVGYDLDGRIVLVGGGQWPEEWADCWVYDVETDRYVLEFPQLNHPRRDHASVFVPLITEDDFDGMPGLWVFGGRHLYDDPPYQPAEFFPLANDNLATPTPTPSPTPVLNTPTPTPSPQPTDTPTVGPSPTPTDPPTKTPTPTASPSPTITPTPFPLEHSIYLPVIPKNDVVVTPTSTATPTPTCGEAVQNGGFEQGHSVWVEESADGSDIITNTWPDPYEGSWVAEFGGYDDADDILTQLIYVHPDAQNDQSLTFYVYVETTDTSITTTDKFVVRFLDESGTWPVSADIPIADNTTPMDWAYMPIALTGFEDVRGLYLQLQFEATTDSALPTRFVIDQVSLDTACGGGVRSARGRRWISVSE